MTLHTVPRTQEGLKCVYKDILLSLVMRPISKREKESRLFQSALICTSAVSCTHKLRCIRPFPSCNSKGCRDIKQMMQGQDYVMERLQTPDRSETKEQASRGWSGKTCRETLGVWIYWTTKDELNISCFGKNVDHVLKIMNLGMR